MTVQDQLRAISDQLRALYYGQEAECANCGSPGNVGTSIEFFPNIPEAAPLSEVTFSAACADDIDCRPSS